MSGLSRNVLISAMAAAALMAPAPTRRLDPQTNDAPRLMQPFDLLRMLGNLPVHHTTPRYIKRPFHTTAEMKRKARKARNVRRHKLQMKRRGHR